MTIDSAKVCKPLWRQSHDQHLKLQRKGKLIEHKRYIAKHGEDLPEIRNWAEGAINAGKTT